MYQDANETAGLNERSDRLIDLLKQQRECYGELKRLAQNQRQLITDQNPEALLTILAERQRLVDRLASLNKALQPFRQEWSETYTLMNDDRRLTVRRMLDEINTLLGSILVTDAEDSRLLAAGKENIRTQLVTTTTGRMANSAYAAQAYRTVKIDASQEA